MSKNLHPIKDQNGIQINGVKTCSRWKWSSRLQRSVESPLVLQKKMVIRCISILTFVFVFLKLTLVLIFNPNLCYINHSFFNLAFLYSSSALVTCLTTISAQESGILASWLKTFYYHFWKSNSSNVLFFGR